MVKIAFIGTHGVGKTTLCYDVGAVLKKKGLHVDLVKEVARLSPLPINRKTSLEAQLWILATQIAEEIRSAAHHEVVICDRSVLDNYAYLVFAAGRQRWLEPLVNRWMKSYDLLFKVPIRAVPPPQTGSATRRVLHAPDRPPGRRARRGAGAALRQAAGRRPRALGRDRARPGDEAAGARGKAVLGEATDPDPEIIAVRRAPPLSDLYEPSKRRVRIVILGRVFEVPEKNILLRQLQYVSEDVGMVRYCWNAECRYCEVQYQRPGDPAEHVGLACRCGASTACA